MRSRSRHRRRHRKLQRMRRGFALGFKITQAENWWGKNTIPTRRKKSVNLSLTWYIHNMKSFRMQRMKQTLGWAVMRKKIGTFGGSMEVFYQHCCIEWSGTRGRTTCQQSTSLLVKTVLQETSTWFKSIFLRSMISIHRPGFCQMILKRLKISLITRGLRLSLSNLNGSAKELESSWRETMIG